MRAGAACCARYEGNGAAGGAPRPTRPIGVAGSDAQCCEQAQNAGVLFTFVNDGSTDKTLTVLEDLASQRPNRISVPNAVCAGRGLGVGAVCEGDAGGHALVASR